MIDKVCERLRKYGIIKDKTADITRRIELASNWSRDFPSNEEKFEIEMNLNYKQAIAELIDVLLKLFIGSERKPEASKDLQAKIFGIARDNGMEPRELFILLYRMLINSDKGPKLEIIYLI